MSDQRKWSLLGGLMLVLLALVAIRVLNQPEPQRVPLTYKSGQKLARDAARGVASLPTPVKPRTPKNKVTFREPKNIFARLGSVSDTASDAQARGGKKPKLAMAAVPGPVQGPPPPPPEEPPKENHPLFSLPNVTLTPHSAGPTWENWTARFRNGFDNIQRVAAGRAPLWVIPELAD